MNDGFSDNDEVEISFLGCAALIAQAIDSLDGRAEMLSLIAFKRAESGELDLAVDLADTISDSYLRDQALAGIAAKCIQVGAADYADKISDMIEDDAAYAVATEQMSVAYAESGKFEKAIEVAHSLADSGPALSRIALACAAGGLTTQALELARSIDYADLKVFVLIELAARALQDGRSDEALGLLPEATTAAEEIEFFEQRVSTLVTIASLAKKAGREEQALEVLSRSLDLCNETDDPARDVVLAQIAGAFAELQRYDRADQIIEEIENPFHFAHATAGVALEYHKAGDSAKALAFLTQAFEIVRDEEVYGEQSLSMRENLLDELAYGYAVVGRYDEALQATGLMNSEDQQNRTLGQIAILSVTSGNHHRLGQVTELIKDNYARVLCEVEIVDAFMTAEEFALADHTLFQALAETAPIERPYQKATALMATAPRFARREQAGKASEVLIEALTTLAMIDGRYLQSHALINLAGIYQELGQQPGEREQKVLEEIIRKLD